MNAYAFTFTINRPNKAAKVSTKLTGPGKPFATPYSVRTNTAPTETNVITTATGKLPLRFIVVTSVFPLLFNGGDRKKPNRKLIKRPLFSS